MRRAWTRRVETGLELPGQEALVWLAPGTSLVGLGPFLKIDPGAGPGRFARAEQALNELFSGTQVADEVDLPGTGPVAFGSFTFDPAAEGSMVWVPSVVLGTGDGASWITEFSLAGDKTGPLGDEIPPRRPGPSPGPGWNSMVARALRMLGESDLEKVVLARYADQAVAVAQPELVAALAAQNPGCFIFCLGGLVGASPELLVRRLGDVVDSMPLAGSAPRGDDDTADAALGRGLQASAKNRMEHELTVGDVVDNLAPLCRQIAAEPDPSLLLLPNVQHLSTKVQGRLSKPLSALALAGRLHPTAAVCGVPRERALQAIRSLEPEGRGRYAGPVGWVDHRGDGEWAIALRCGMLGAGTARIWAGAGVVAGSDAAEELAETEMKLMTVRLAIASLGGGLSAREPG